MRDERFKAVHRGGPLDPQRHRLLAAWAADCAERALPLFSGRHPRDDRPRKAVDTARAWARGEVSVGEARAAGAEAHDAARDATDLASRAAARAAGHAAGTAHMADHAPGAARYALQAAQAANHRRDISDDSERTWQIEHAPEEIRPLIVAPDR